MDQHGHPAGGHYGGIPYPPSPASPSRLETAGSWRLVFAAVTLVLGCLLAPVALAGVWFHARIMDVDGWVSTAAPVADESAVREAVADVLSEQISDALDTGWTIPGLPDGLDIVPDTLGSRGFGELTRELTLQAVSSGAFRGFWAAANRRVHPILLDAIEGEGSFGTTADGLVSLDLGDVTRDVTDLLAVSGVTLPDVLPVALTSGDVALLHSEPLAEAGGYISALDRLYWLLIVAALGFLSSSVLVAPRRLPALARAGAGLAVGMAALEGGVAAGGAYYLGVTDDAGIPHDASAAIFRVMTGELRLWGWALLAAGLVLALVAAAAHLIARRGSSAGASGGSAHRGGVSRAGGV